MKGNIAKENITTKIKQAFGEDYVGEFDKKLYIWADDGGERVQIALSMTHPKVYKGIGEVVDCGGINFDDEPAAAEPFKPAEVTQQEKDNLEALMARLGL